MNRLWASVQAMLGASANVSKLLWGTNAEAEKRREPLRRSLEVPDDSPIRDRDMRNAFEHFDERLEDWASEGHSVAVDSNVGPLESFIKGVDSKTFLRHFDPTTGVITFRGQSHDMRPILDALEELQARAKKQSARYRSITG